MTAELRGLAEVGRHKDPQHVAMREQQHVALYRRDLGEQRFCAPGYATERFAAQRALGEYVPSRPLRANLGTRPPFVVAVVHFQQEVGGLQDSPKPRELGGASCAL